MLLTEFFAGLRLRATVPVFRTSRTKVREATTPAQKASSTAGRPGAANASRHAHRVREHAVQSSLSGWRAAACVRTENETLEAETTRRRKPYLDLKRIKTVAPGWRCAAVCYTFAACPTSGELDLSTIQKTCCTWPSATSAGCRVECESTPTILWMSSSKRYIWYFTLR